MRSFAVNRFPSRLESNTSLGRCLYLVLWAISSECTQGEGPRRRTWTTLCKNSWVSRSIRFSPRITWSSVLSRYEKTLSDCHECYAMQRRALLTFSVQSAIQDLALKNERDMCTLVKRDCRLMSSVSSWSVQVRGGCAFLLHLCQDEYQLFYQFFSKHSVHLE